MGFYVKLGVADEVEVKVQVYGDEFYSVCPKCEKEERISVSELGEIEESSGDLSGGVYCRDCSKE
ncbi:hypothetical protein J416_09324 [Gracilibacillus halophilus YIM-C55.5]|uniref:Uncharacterized protein n=1 Tax=Gracilibacillus halophilus YIM-C55.5 TaxID=1308866 RepID=N4WKK1_9BACI|nr:hypothetical protein [Gracilibacillus halophilus]ENH96687.1 hypothetical protein J416_09324 [Gracilibacillus halophilus YIM-C55.5]